MNIGYSKSQGRLGQPSKQMGSNEDDMDISPEDYSNQQGNVSVGIQHVPVGSQQRGQYESMAINAHHGQFRNGNLLQTGVDRGHQQQHEYENAPMEMGDRRDVRQSVPMAYANQMNDYLHNDETERQQHHSGQIGTGDTQQHVGGSYFQQEHMSRGDHQNRPTGGDNYQQEHMRRGHQQNRSIGGGNFQKNGQDIRGHHHDGHMEGDHMQRGESSGQMERGNHYQDAVGGQYHSHGNVGGSSLRREPLGRDHLHQGQRGGRFDHAGSMDEGYNQNPVVGMPQTSQIPKAYQDSAAYEDDQRQMAQRQQQQQRQMMRSLQASKQMAFGTFENIIGDLEELEAREEVSKHKKPVTKSDIKIPDQSKKRNSDLESITETQLLIFQTQLKACPKEVREEVRTEMINKTLTWCAAREETQRPHTKTDVYAAKLYELLQTGQTSHSKEFQNPPQISEADMREAVSAIMVGQHQQRDLDESFKTNPKKKAAMKKIRSGEALDSGIRRIQTTRPDLGRSLEMYMENSLR